MKKLKVFVSIIVLLIVFASLFSYLLDWVNPIYNKKFKTNYIAIGDETYQTMEGFGASSCWNSQVYGSDIAISNEISRVLYSNQDGCLGLNIYRYNIGGGGSDEAIADEYPYNQGWYQKDRGAETFLKSEEYTGSTPEELLEFVSDPNNYDFNKDINAQKALISALQYGNITQLVLFANSPNRLMTLNGRCTGTEAKQNNLREDAYEAFAKYLIVITDHFVDILEDNNLLEECKIVLSPINEPQWKWGGSSASQEGCHYDPDKCALALNYVWEELVEYRNTKPDAHIVMDAFESGKINLGSKVYKYINEIKKYDYYDELESISVHAYGDPLENEQRITFNSRVDKPASMTEYCQLEAGLDLGIGGGVHIAQVMSKDLYYLDSVSWSWWLGVSMLAGDYNDGIIYIDWDRELNAYVDGTLTLPKRYYAMMNFTRFVATGDKRIDSQYCFGTSDDIDQVVFQCEDGSYSMILVNSGDENLNMNLQDGFSSMKVYVTDKNKSCEKVYDGNFNSEFELGGNSIVTIKLYK